MSYSPPLTKSFHYDTFFFFFIWHKCLLDQELICQLFLFWFLFSFSFYTFFLKTRVCSSLRLFCRSGGAFVIRVFHYAERLIQKQTFIHFFFFLLSHSSLSCISLSVEIVLFFHRRSLDLRCLSKTNMNFFFFESWSNFMPQCAKCACQHWAEASEVHQPALIYFFIVSSFYLFNSVYRFLSNLHPLTICFWSLFLLYFFFFFCLPDLEDLRACPFDATSSHFACYCYWATRKKRKKRLYSRQTIHCFFCCCCFF